jgi:hypothetical protein
MSGMQARPFAMCSERASAVSAALHCRVILSINARACAARGADKNTRRGFTNCNGRPEIAKSIRRPARLLPRQDQLMHHLHLRVPHEKQIAGPGMCRPNRIRRTSNQRQIAANSVQVKQAGEGAEPRICHVQGLDIRAGFGNHFRCSRRIAPPVRANTFLDVAGRHGQIARRSHT